MAERLLDNFCKHLYSLDGDGLEMNLVLIRQV